MVSKLARRSGGIFVLLFKRLPISLVSQYRIIPTAAVATARNRYPDLKWPADRLAIGEAFIVPLFDGTDIDGRSEAYIRVLADKIGKRLGRKFSCNKVDEGMAISRTA